MFSALKNSLALIVLMVCFPHFIKSQSTIVGDTSLPANNFELGGFLTVNYEFNEDDSITMAITCNRPGQFFGLGLGTSMRGADIWVFELVDSQVRVRDYYSSRETYPRLDTDLGGQDNLEVLGYQIDPAFTIVKIKRALDTGDAQDKVIQLGPTDFIFATARSPVLAYHGSTKGAAQITLEENPVVVVDPPVITEENESIETEFESSREEENHEEYEQEQQYEEEYHEEEQKQVEEQNTESGEFQQYEEEEQMNEENIGLEELQQSEEELLLDIDDSLGDMLADLWGSDV